MEFLRERGRSISARYDFNVGTGPAGFGSFDSFIEFAACGYARCHPVVAAERLRKLVVVPFRKVVAVTFRILAEQAFDEVAVIVEHENDRFQPKTIELADFLRCQLVRAFTCDEDHPSV